MKVLLVEDTEKLSQLIAENLQSNGYVVETAETAEDALYFTEVEKYDAIILDRMLPNNQDGVEVCNTLRSRNDPTPVLMLTALGTVERKMEGFASGADDYLAKPFDMRELLARVSALTRRSSDTPTPVFVSVGDVDINLSKRQVNLRGKEVALSKRLWRLLEYLALHRGQAISKEILIDHVWGINKDVLENTVEVAIRNLRQKLNDPKGDIIQTVYGFGYRLKS